MLETESAPLELGAGENHPRTWDGSSWKAKAVCLLCVFGASLSGGLSALYVTLPRICSTTGLIDDAVNGIRGTLR